MKHFFRYVLGLNLKSALAFLPLLLGFCCLFADGSGPYTVIAIEGVPLRVSPDFQAPVSVVLPFGTIVQTSEVSYDEAHAGVGRSQERPNEAANRDLGNWLHARFGDQEGYVLSNSSIRFGEWVVPSSEMNKDYRLLNPGKGCVPLNYDPNLLWYALVRQDGIFSLKKSTVILRWSEEFSDKDTLGEENAFWEDYEYYIQTDLQDPVMFLLGSATPLVEGVLNLAADDFFDWNYVDGVGAKFLAPGETFTETSHGNSYRFKADTFTKKNKDGKDGLLLYKLDFQFSGSHATTLHFGESMEMHAAESLMLYRVPKMILKGDLNQDHLMDFMYVSTNLNEGCGIEFFHHLFLSNGNDPNNPIKKVATNTFWHCYP